METVPKSSSTVRGRRNNVSSGEEKNSSGPESEMGEVQETIASRECQNIEVRFSENFRCWQKADRCRRKGKEPGDTHETFS